MKCGAMKTSVHNTKGATIAITFMNFQCGSIRDIESEKTAIEIENVSTKRILSQSVVYLVAKSVIEYKDIIIGRVTPSAK